MTQTLDWIDKIPPEHAGQPDFETTVKLSVQPIVRLEHAIQALIPDFDLDTAIGAQLDIVGQWVGRSRDITVPLQGLYFSFDNPALGFDLGVWKGPYDTGTGVSRLSDDEYRSLLRGKILSNSWNGTAAGAQAILDAFFGDPATHVFVQFEGQAAHPVAPGVPSLDQLDMSMIVGVSGKRPPLLYLALLSEGYLPTKPVGVRLTYLVTSVDRTPMFGFDVQNEFIAGFDTGSWGIGPYDPTSNLNSLPNGFFGSLDFTRAINSGQTGVT